MISGDDYLAMSDGDSLRRLEAEYRLADNAHIASGSSRVRSSLADRWRRGVKASESDATILRDAIKNGPLTLADLCTQSPELVSSLLPVWTASPLVLPMVLPGNWSFDAVLVLDAESTSLQAAVPALARAAQVVAFGDGQLGGPRPFTIGVEPVPAAAVQQDMVSVFEALAKILPTRTLSTVYRGTDRALLNQLSRSFYDGRLTTVPRGSDISSTERSLVVEYLADGTGMPSSEHEGVESVAAEVNRVVDLVFEHIRRRPHESLAVVTASPRHAVRVAEAIRVQMANFPWASDFFTPGKESFRVVPVDRAAGLVRDSVIFSLGFGRTPHGRALHTFGPLSSSHGRGKFLTAMTRARSRLHVLTCFRPEDLDKTRLGYGALDFYELISRELDSSAASTARRGSAAADSASRRSDGAGGIMDEDALVADLVERLRARGAKVWDHYQGTIDIVATVDRSNADGEPTVPMAIESDGTEHYRTMSVRERSRLRPQLLERMGWRYMPLWTIEVFSDPSACADLVGRYLNLPAPRENDGRSARTGGTSVSGSLARRGSLLSAPHGSTRAKANTAESARPAQVNGSEGPAREARRP